MDQTALYLERFMNYGITPDELRSGRPIIGISQTGSDLVPCNRHHLDLAVVWPRTAAYYRLGAWRATWAGEAPRFITRYNQPHNTFVEALSTRGPIGLLSLLALLASRPQHQPDSK